MQYKITPVPVADPRPFEEELNTFLRSHRIVSVKTEFVASFGTGESSAFCFLVEYIEGNTSRGNKPGRIDYREVLSDDEFAIFAKLRKTRQMLAEQHGVPIYAVFTNEQLANIARKPPASLSEMESIEGIGEGKREKYGQAILDTLSSATS